MRFMSVLLAVEEVVAVTLEVVAEMVISVRLISVACVGMGSGNLAVSSSAHEDAGAVGHLDA